MAEYTYSWMRTGVPLRTPAGMGTARWDGSRWVSTNKNSVVSTPTSSGFMNTDESLPTESVQARAMLDDPTASMAAQRALSSFGKTMGGNAINSGIQSGLAYAAGLVPASTAVDVALKSSLNPMNFIGSIGNAIDAAYGFDTTGKTGLTALSTAALGPIGAVLAGTLGGYATDAFADMRNSRLMEGTKDYIEDLPEIGYHRARTLSADIAETARDAFTNSSGDVIAAARASIGAAENAGVSGRGYANIAADTVAMLGGRHTPNEADKAIGELLSSQIAPGGDVLGGLAAADPTNFGSVNQQKSASVSSGMDVSVVSAIQDFLDSINPFSPAEDTPEQTPAQEAMQEIQEEVAMQTALDNEPSSDESNWDIEYEDVSGDSDYSEEEPANDWETYGDVYTFGSDMWE